MALNLAAAFGMYSPNVVLNDVMHSLNQAGFQNEDICMMLPPTHPLAAMLRDASLFNSEGISDGVTAGLIGWLSEFGAVLIPTVGFFIRSHLFFRALMVQETPAMCGHASSLSGLGFSPDQADRFENRLRNNGVLVYVASSERAKTEWACEVLRNSGADEAAMLQNNLGMRTAAAVA